MLNKTFNITRDKQCWFSRKYYVTVDIVILCEFQNTPTHGCGAKFSNFSCSDGKQNACSLPEVGTNDI